MTYHRTLLHQQLDASGKYLVELMNVKVWDCIHDLFDGGGLLLKSEKEKRREEVREGGGGRGGRMEYIRSLAGFYPLIRLQGLFVTYGHVVYLCLSYQFIFKDVCR